MNRNLRRQAHDLKRSWGGILGRVAGGNHLAAQNDEPEPVIDGSGTVPSCYPDGPLDGGCLQRAVDERRGHR